MNGTSQRAERTALLVRWVPALAWMAVIFVLSSQSNLAVSQDVSVESPIRIVAHLASYALLGGLLLFALVGRRAPGAGSAVSAFGVAGLYAISDELHQALVPGRNGRPEDVLVDLAGAALGLAVAAALLGLAERRRSAAAPATVPPGGSAGRLEGDVAIPDGTTRRA